MKKKWQISRRRMLKGMGACIALPFLEAMALPRVNTPAYGNSPLRTAFLFMPNGVHPAHWTPEKIGSDFELTRQLLPLQKLKDEIPDHYRRRYQRGVYTPLWLEYFVAITRSAVVQRNWSAPCIRQAIPVFCAGNKNKGGSLEAKYLRLGNGRC